MEQEIWKPVRICEKYEVSNLGRVRKTSTKKIIRPYTDRLQTYDRVGLYYGGKRRRAMVHSLVADAFIGPKPKGYEIDHFNTNIHDNRLCNIGYVTRAANRNNPISKFNYEVSRIRKAILSGKHSQEEIMRLVKVMKAAI